MPAEVAKVKEIFLAALEAPLAGRAAFLDQACAGDQALRQQIEAMLRSHEQSGELLSHTPAEMLHDGCTAAEATAAGSTPGAPVAEDLSFLEPALRPGVLGRLRHYEVQKVLGRGGFGIVLKAFDERLHRVVAIKVLSPAYAANGAARKRFTREARAAAAVKNEHVVGIHDVQADVEPPYLVMEYIDGISLEEKIEKKGPLDLKEILRIGMQMAEGLAAAHKQGLVHRDIKPANILLENGVERVKITDFGLARAVDDASVTQSGTVAGTPMYMSPEQAEGLPIDHRSDLFSLGTVLYAMCTGHPPFRASGTHAVLKRVIDAAPRPIREINDEMPEWLCAIVARLHAKKPEDRPASAREIADLLGQRLADLQAGRAAKVAAKPAVAENARGNERRRGVPPLAWLGGGLLIALVVLALWMLRSMLSAEQLRADAHRAAAAAAAVVPDAGPGWVQLFNGKDVSDWLPSPTPMGTWAVVDGVLEARTAFRDYLFTKRGNYRNFHLRVEAKINVGGDGGLLFRCEHGLSSKFKTVRGYEAEMSDLPDGTPQGTLWLGPEGPNNKVPAKRGKFRPGQWFIEEVIANEGHIVIKIDNEVVVDYVDKAELYREGHIALQVWGDKTELAFRKVEIRELPAAAAKGAERPVEWTDLFAANDLTGWRAIGADAGAWKVADGVVRATGKAGYLVSDRSFGDFHLKGEVRMSARHAWGIDFRTDRAGKGCGLDCTYERPTNDVKKQVQMLMQFNYDGRPAARLTSNFLPEKWHAIEFLAMGDSVNVIVAGGSLGGYKLSLAPGPIVLRLPKPEATLEMRNLRILELPPAAEKKPAEPPVQPNKK